MREIPVPPALATACYLHASAPGPEFQNVQLSLNLGESRPVTQLQDAWKQVAATHPVFGSSFSKAPTGEILRRENEIPALAWSALNWKDVPLGDIPARWQTLLEEDARVPFDLSAPPLIRFQAIELPGGHCHQLVTFPRVLFDDDALFHLLCEWLEVLEGRPSQDAETTVLPPGANPAAADWWSRFFSKAQEPLHFEIYPRQSSGDGPARRRENSLYLDRSTSQELNSFCRNLNLPPRDLFLAVWSLVLSRLTSREGALLLAPCPGPGAGNLLPCFPGITNTSTVGTWLREVAQGENERAANAAIGLERTLLLSDPPRKLRDFPAAFFFSPPPLDDRIHDAFPRWINFDAKIVSRSQFPLTLQVREGTRFFVQIESDPGICPPADAAALLERVIRTLGSLLENPTQKVGELGVLTETEHLALGSATTTPDLPSAELVEKVVGGMADRQPDTLAITGPDDAALSFVELDSHARSLATWLRNENAADGWNIAVCLTSTPWLPVAILGILRAGDTCVPLNPHSSPKWLSGRIDQSDVELIVCDSSTAPFFDGSSRRLLILDQQWDAVAASTGGADPQAQKFAFLLIGTEFDPAPALRSLNPAFLTAACHESGKLWALEPGDRIPLLAAPGTGAFVETLICSLVSGATLVLPDENDPLSVVEEGITHLRLSSSQWRVLFARFQRNDRPLPESLRTVCVETDSILARPRALWKKLTDGRINDIFFFSPAGISGASIRLLPSHEISHATEDLPAGFPGPGVTATLRDPAGQTLPPHYPGRLEVSFPQNGPEKSTLSAWRDKSGAFHFVPSSLAAVEQAFTALPEVLDAHCAIVQDDHREQTAVWVILKDHGARISPETIRAVSQLLPAHLRPDFVLDLAEFPLTAVGHIDTGKLPRPSPATPAPPIAKLPEPPAASSTTWEPLVRLHDNPDAPVLFLVHDFGGDPEKYNPLAHLLKDDWSLYGTTARGLNQPSACHLTLETEAAALVEAICLLDPDGPFHLFGYGFGAILALEMARQLRVAGRQVPYLVLVGSKPPQGQTRADWRSTLSRFFSLGSPKEAPRADRSTPATDAHRTALQNYLAQPLEGPAGIILGADMGRNVEIDWMDFAPEAFIETISSSTAEMLTEPPVKRLAVIMREWVDSSASGSGQ